MKYEINKTSYGSGSFDTYTVTEGEAWIMYIVHGTGFMTKYLRAGESWNEGPGEEVYGVYDTEEAAQHAIDNILAR